MLHQNLTKLGFSPSEIAVYLQLLKTGSSYANKISSETKINRSNVYEALDRLISKGVVSFIAKNKVKWFEAKSPEAIISLLKEKGEEINKIEKEIQQEIYELKKLAQTKKPLEANVFTGKKALRILFDEMVVSKKDISLFGADKIPFREIFGPYFELWHKMRIKNGIKQKSIFPRKFKVELEMHKKQLQKTLKKTLIKYKYIDDKFLSPTATFVYGNNCIFIHWSKEPIAIKIQNNEIAKSHQNYFDMLWKS